MRVFPFAYDGLDPLSGEERRLWHPVGLARLTHVEFPLAFAPAAAQAA